MHVYIQTYIHMYAVYRCLMMINMYECVHAEREDEQARRLELQVVPAPELPEAGVVPALRGLKG